MRNLLRIVSGAAFPALFILAASVSGPAAARISFQQEMAMSDQAAKQVQKDYKLTNDPELTRIGRIIAWNSRIPVLSFQMAETDEINAFALPGRIYFCRGLWDKLDEQERAGILGHEIGHVAEHHSIRQIEKDQKRTVFLQILVIAVDANATQADIAAIANALIGLKYSREFENDADKDGIELTRRAGYDPHGVLRALEKLQELSKGSHVPEFLSTHPLTKDRIENVRQRVAAITFTPPPGGPQLPPPADLLAEARRRLRQYDVEMEGNRSISDLYESSYDAMVWSTYAVDEAPRNVEAQVTLGDARAAAAKAGLAAGQGDSEPEWSAPKSAFARAREAYEAALALDASAGDAAAGKARVLLAQGDKNGAERTLRDFLGSDPRSAAAWAALGDVLTAEERKADAADAFGRSLQARSADADSLYAVGFGFLRIDQKPRAAEAFQAFLTRATDDPRRDVVQKRLDSIR
jgi:predicted Zn-dependent protease